MNKIEKQFGVAIGTLFLSFVLAAMSDWSHAGAGADDADWIAQGTYMEMRRVHVTSDVAALVWSAASGRGRVRVNSICQAIGGTVWLGTHTAWSPSVTHPNIQVGLMLTASNTITLDGNYQGDLYVTGDVGLSTVNVRCLDQLVR